MFRLVLRDVDKHLLRKTSMQQDLGLGLRLGCLYRNATFFRVRLGLGLLG